MSESKAGGIDLLITALDTVQTTQDDHTTILTNLEARKIVDLAGVERRLEELADAIVAQHTPGGQRRRRWWVTPVLLTLATLGGMALMVGILYVRFGVQPLAPVATKQAPAVTTTTPPRKGR